MHGVRYGPTHSHRRPAYPTKLQVRSRPDLLRKRMPAAWITNRELAAAAGVFVAAGAVGCAKPARTPVSSEAPAIVAPLFEHGDGRGSTGCMVVAPPVFLSEEDALQVIHDELRRSGVDLSQSDVALADVVVDQAPYAYVRNQAGASTRVPQPEHTLLRVAGFDPQRRIAVEFVSHADQERFLGPWNNSLTFGTSYDMKMVAHFLDQAVADHAHGIYFAVFYDPLVHSDTFRVWAAMPPQTPAVSFEQTWKEKRAMAQDDAKELLREQVRDFIDWLKAQGVI